MKIVHLFYYPGSGGAEKYAVYLAQEAKKSGHEVRFLLGQDGPMTKNLKISNFKYQISEMPSWCSMKAALRLKKYLQENETEIVHAHFLREHFLAVWAKIFGAKIKIVRTFHRLDQLPVKVRPFYGFFQTKTDAFIAVSDYLKEKMVREGIVSKKITVIYNGVPALRVSAHGQAIGYLGRLSREKGILEFLRKNKDYFSKVDSCELLIAGDGPDKIAIEKLIKDNNLTKVHLLGQVNELSDFFSKISILVLPSATEVLPLVIPESYSVNIPIVCFDIAPLRGVVENKYMAPFGDHKALLDLALLKMGADSKQHLEKIFLDKYSVNKMWQKTNKLYEKILSSK